MTKRCAGCQQDRPLSRFGAGKGTKYCDDCRRRQYLERKRLGKLGGPGRCEYCAESFVGSSPAQRFCSRACARRQRQLGARKCQHCGSQFQPRASTQRFCSYACKSAGMRAEIGTRRVNKHSYVLIRVPENTPGLERDRAWMLEHRYVMQQSLGRPLESYETVHHVNGDKTDNRIENLQLRTGRHGKGVVHECLDCGSSNIVEVAI